MRITVLPIGQVSLDTLQAIQEGLRKAFPRTEVTINENTMPIPSEAYNPSRRQFHSTHILTKLSNRVKSVEAERVLGVTEADLYAPNLNFVFGEAQLSGKVAIVSLFRLKPDFYGQLSNDQLFLERALKEAVHEIGHTLGLRHCQNPSCIMFFSNSIHDTDKKRAEFCEKCRPSVLEVLQR